MNLHDLIIAALKEDMPSGDVTTENLGLGPHWGRARLIAKQDLSLSGMNAFEQTVLALDPQAKLKWHFSDGDEIALFAEARGEGYRIGFGPCTGTGLPAEA